MQQPKKEKELSNKEEVYESKKILLHILYVFQSIQISRNIQRKEKHTFYKTKQRHNID